MVDGISESSKDIIEMLCLPKEKAREICRVARLLTSLVMLQ